MSNPLHKPEPDGTLLKLAADSAPAMIWIGGPEGERTWFNQAWLSFVGRTLEQEAGSGWTWNVHAEDRAACLDTLRQALAGCLPFQVEYRLGRADGEPRWILDSGKPYHDRAGRLGGYLGSCVDITERKGVEVRLRASEQRFRQLSESAPTMIWLSDANGKCLHLNRRLREFWGVSNDQLGSFDWATTIHPEDVPRVFAQVQAAVEKRSGFVIEARYRNHAGDYRILRTEAEPEFGSSGATTGFVGVNVDVTEQIEATHALQMSERRFAGFMSNLPGLAWIKDADGRYVYANEAAASAFGTPLGELLGRSDDDIFPTEVAERFKYNDAQARANAGGVRVLETLPHPDGYLHHSIVSKFPIPAGGADVPLVGGVAIDVTDHKAAEDRVRQLNEDLRHRLEEQQTLLGALPVAVFIARDRECRHITMNAAGAAMLRLPAASNASMTGAEGATLPFRVFKDGKELHPQDLPMQRAARLAVDVLGEEVDVAFSDGSTLTLHESASPLFDADGSARGCVGVFVDITERKLAEKQKNLLIDELNHRVKNTLAIVQSIASQTLRQTPDPKSFREAFSARVEALSLAHSLLTKSSWEGIPLDELVAAALGPFETADGRVAFAGPPVMIKPAAAVTLCLILHELATNAVKHGALSVEGGRLGVIWSAAGDTVSLDWTERDGPPVRHPARQGFGMRLISASVDQFGGSVRLGHGPACFEAKFQFKV